MYEALIDLDELILLCRDKLAKKFIQEAVTCYKVGAYRSSIVSTWNAVVFDFLYKLRELDLCGENKATLLLKKFEELSSAKNVRGLWEFESDIPKQAHLEFELISTVEKSDIERLFEDRSRCAHPSMTSLEEPFEATAELARYHLRSAVMNLLQHQPVQGRSARERIFQDIKSEYFPTEPEAAVKYFQKSPLARARFSLIKDVVCGLTISLLIDNLLEDERNRQFAAINAIELLYHKETKEILNDQLSNIILKKVTDDNWGKVLIYLGSVKSWDNLDEPCLLKAINFIKKIDLFEKNTTKSFFNTFFNSKISEQNLISLSKASYVPFFRVPIEEKLSELSFEELLKIKQEFIDNIFLQNIINQMLGKILPRAEFDELITLYINDESFEQISIENSLKLNLSNTSFKDIIKALKKAFKYEKYFLYKILESLIISKIESSALDDLPEALSNYKIFIDEPNKKVLDIFVTKIYDGIQALDCQNLLLYLSISQYKDELPNDFINQKLEKNLTMVLNQFKESNSWGSARSNAKILERISHLISNEDWEKILDTFCNNDQIYNSFACSETFYSLFEKDIDLKKGIQPYWRDFRDKLNSFKASHLVTLKKSMDSLLNQ